MINETSIFQVALDKFISHVYTVINEGSCITNDYGKRYVKLIIKNKYGHESVYGFIDQTNGDILKAASWKAPAKHARGNIYDENTYSSAATTYGISYLK